MRDDHPVETVEEAFGDPAARTAVLTGTADALLAH
jgi:hypothetical protein